MVKEMLGPKYSDSAQKGELGVQKVSSILIEKFGWVFKRTPQESDFGIDGQVEVVNSTNVVTGQTFAVQIKYGKSFLSEETRWGYVYRGELKHINYFLNYPMPVFIFLCDPETENIYWELFDLSRTDKTEKAWKMTVPRNQILQSSQKTILNLIPAAFDFEDTAEEFWLMNKFICDFTDYTSLVITRDWVESLDISKVIEFFDRLMVSTELAFSKKGKIDISFHGYDSDSRELFEIPEVVIYAKAMAEKLPLLFFCNPSPKLYGLKCIGLSCFNAHFVSCDRSVVKFDNYAFARFFYKQYELLNKITDWLGMTDEENDEICSKVHERFQIDFRTT